MCVAFIFKKFIPTYYLNITNPILTPLTSRHRGFGFLFNMLVRQSIKNFMNTQLRNHVAVAHDEGVNALHHGLADGESAGNRSHASGAVAHDENVGGFEPAALRVHGVNAVHHGGLVYGHTACVKTCGRAIDHDELFVVVAGFDVLNLAAAQHSAVVVVHGEG